MFQSLLQGIRHDVVHTIYKVGIVKQATSARAQAPALASTPVTEAGQRREAVTVAKKVGRNDPCPCGSGKKYKKCCGS